MNELDMFSVINKKLSRTEFLGNDCAKIYDYVSSLPLIVTHDTLVEDVHFSLTTTNPFELAMKAVSVNVSDLRAAFAYPKYLSVSLSLPKDVSKEFLENFYEGIEAACDKYSCCLSGGDLTRSDKIVISICAIGQQIRRLETGRQYAQTDDLVLLFGNAGFSDLGFRKLQENPNLESVFTRAHLAPEIDLSIIEAFSELPLSSICAMDTSDGLADAIYKISAASGHQLHIDASKLPVNEDFREACEHFNVDVKDVLLFGAEDYSLVVTLNQEYARLLNIPKFHIIGKVGDKSDNPVSTVTFGDEIVCVDEALIRAKTFKHFDD